MKKQKRIDERLKSAFKAALYAWRGYDIVAADHAGAQSILKMTDRGLIRERVAAAIGKVLKSESPRGEAQRQELIEQIVADIYGERFYSTLGRIVEMYENNLGLAYHRLVVAAGLTTLWESDLRIFATRMGIEVVVPTQAKKKRNVSIIAPHFRKIEELYNELLESAPNLKMNIRRQLDLRGSLVHGNIRELRQVYLKGKRKSEHAENKGMLWELDLQKNEVFNLADDHDNAFIDSRDVHGLFLEGVSSSLFENVTKEFMDAMFDLHALLEFSTYSELVPVMRSMMKGELLTELKKTEIIQLLEAHSVNNLRARALLDRVIQLSSK